VGVLLAVISGLLWLLTLKMNAERLPVAALVFSVLLAAFGLFDQAPPALMIVGSTAALACWDLALLDHSLKGSVWPETAGYLEKKHVQSLVLSLGIGLLLAVFTMYFTLRVTFGWMVLLVIADLFCLDRVWRYVSLRRFPRQADGSNSASPEGS
jgi:hypothetical protein